MHNRARMVVASFLTKDLYIDWRRGAAHFMSLLVDGDVANNQLNWQWTAGTGTDSNPNRIFNPTVQSKRFDPTATTSAGTCRSWPTCRHPRSTSRTTGDPVAGRLPRRDRGPPRRDRGLQGAAGGPAGMSRRGLPCAAARTRPRTDEEHDMTLTDAPGLALG